MRGFGTVVRIGDPLMDGLDVGPDADSFTDADYPTGAQIDDGRSGGGADGACAAPREDDQDQQDDAGRDARRRRVCFSPRPRCRGAMRIRRRGWRWPSGSFNPRPPLPGGDALPLLLIQARWPVSIHAPRCRGAMPTAASSIKETSHVSIHAPRCRGAMPPVRGFF